MVLADERKCSRCGKVGKGNVHVHHKDGNYHNNDLTNLIYLCSSCHRLWHSGAWTYEEMGLTSVHLTNPPTTDQLYPVKERTVVFPIDTWEGVVNYTRAELERNKDNELLQKLITPKSLVQHIVRNELQKRKYYPLERIGRRE